jgi:hypothetical protein
MHIESVMCSVCFKESPMYLIIYDGDNPPVCSHCFNNNKNEKKLYRNELADSFESDDL